MERTTSIPVSGGVRAFFAWARHSSLWCWCSKRKWHFIHWKKKTGGCQLKQIKAAIIFPSKGTRSKQAGRLWMCMIVKCRGFQARTTVVECTSTRCWQQQLWGGGISESCIEPLKATEQREQINSCWNWLERRGVICSNQTCCCYNSLLGSAAPTTILHSFLSLYLSVFTSPFLPPVIAFLLSLSPSVHASTLSPSFFPPSSLHFFLWWTHRNAPAWLLYKATSSS